LKGRKLDVSQHLSRAELDRLISDETSGGDIWIESATGHLETCRDCRLALLLGETEAKSIPASSSDGPCPGEARLKRAASGASDAQTALRVVQHCTNCDDCATKLKDYAKLFSGDSEGDLKGLKTSKPEWQKNFARQIANSQKSKSRRLRFGMLGWAIAALLLLAFLITSYIQRDSISKVNELVAAAYTQSRNTDLRLLGARYSEVRTDRGTAAKSEPLAEARAAIARMRPSSEQTPEFLDAEGRADLVSNDIQGAYEKLMRAKAQSPHSSDILIDLALTECLLGDSGQPERYQVAYELLSEVLAADNRNAVALFNRAIVSERLREYGSAIEDWKRLLDLEPTGAWADETRRRKTTDESLLKDHPSATAANEHSFLRNSKVNSSNSYHHQNG